MHVEVIVSGWEQACCGAAIEVGGIASYTLVALDAGLSADFPGVARDAALPRFASDSHGQATANQATFLVEGVVQAITAVNYPRVPAAGMPGTWTNDRANPQLQAVQSVRGSNSDDPDGASEYLVVLTVADDAVLP